MMKHIKIFEDFNKTIKHVTTKYECVKPLPTHRIVSSPSSTKSRPSKEDKNTHDTYFINTGDPEKLKAILAELINNEYDPGYAAPNKDIKSISWYSDTEKGNDMRVNHYYFTKGDMIKSTVQIEVNFDEHFKLKHEYRGHNLKKFGI